jgi:hypothetical protein
MDTTEGHEKIRETILAIRKVLKNKQWRAWARAWLAGKDQTSESAMATAQAMARLLPEVLSTRSRASRETSLACGSACNTAAAAGTLAEFVRANWSADLPRHVAEMIVSAHMRRPLPAAER